MVLHGMIIYEIVRQFVEFYDNTYNLSCTFPSGNRLINVVLYFKDQSKKVQTFQLDSKTSITETIYG